MSVRRAWFNAGMESLLFPLLLMVLVIAASLSWYRRGRGRPERGDHAAPRKPAKRAATPRSPLATLITELQARRARRRTTCDTIRGEIGSSIPADDRLDDGMVRGFVMLALDVWLGRDFTLRNRAVGLSWIPFVDAPEHEETDETRRARLDRVYRLDDSDKAELEQMRKGLEGQFAFLAGVIAARIHAYPAWQLDFFDDRQVRLDLTAQVTSIAAGAASLRDQRAVLGPPPAGHLGKDNHVIGVYIEKARVLDRRADGVLERLRAFAEYRAVVARIQEREEKRSWLDRVGTIDDLDTAVDDVINQGETERLRAVAVDSELLSSLYLDTLEPLTASLTVAEMTKDS